MKLLINGKQVRAEHRCVPCGAGKWDEAPDTTYYVRPICCGKPMVPTGRIENDGDLLTIATRRAEVS